MSTINIELSVNEKGHIRLVSFEMKDFPLEKAPRGDWREITERYILPELRKAVKADS